MEAAEMQLARALAALTECELPQSRSLESRLDAYFQLEDLFHLEDSEASVLELQRHVPLLLSEMRIDLQQNGLSEILHAALRCLSYLMHHRSLNVGFSDDEISYFLGKLVRLLFSTQDISTYKLCLWGITVQNFSPDRHILLPRMVEALVQAVVNPFNSRVIEVQALKGLHLLLVKYPEQLGCSAAVLNLYVRPIASRLTSSEVVTRTQARVVLEEVSKHRTAWPQETLIVVQNCVEEYLLPVMELHMEHNRRIEAVHLWKLMLILLKSHFSNDLEKLNSVLYVAEKCLKDKNGIVRLLALEAWGEMTQVFHDCNNWVFNKAVVGLLIRPIYSCFKQELLLNIIDVAYDSWQKIINVAVLDFNANCKALEKNVEIGQQERVPVWKLWFNELVTHPLLILMEKLTKTKDSASAVKLDTFISFFKQLWRLKERTRFGNKCKKTQRKCSSSNATRGISANEIFGKRALRTRDKEHSAFVRFLRCSSVHLNSKVIGIALLIEDVLGAIHDMIKMSIKSTDCGDQNRINEVVMAMWIGVCQRIKFNRDQDGPTSKLLSRLVRILIALPFGNLASKFSPARRVDVNDSRRWNRKNKQSQIARDEGFRLVWQLQLLIPLVSTFVSLRDLQSAMLHPKCKFFDRINQRVKYLKSLYAQCATVFELWESNEFGEKQVHLKRKMNALPYLVLTPIVEFAIYVENFKCDRGVIIHITLTKLEALMKNLLTKLNFGFEQRDQQMFRFGEMLINAAHDCIASGFSCEKRSILDEFINISKRFKGQTFGSQQLASPLLYSIQSCTRVCSDIYETTSAATHTNLCNVLRTDARNESQASASVFSLILPSSKIPSDPLAKFIKLYRVSSDEPFAISRQRKASKYTFLIAYMIPFIVNQTPLLRKTVGRRQSNNLNGGNCIDPGLAGCLDKIFLLYRHFPLEFRQLFSICKIKTIGDLSALSVDKLKAFGRKETLHAVRQALQEFLERKGCMKTISGSEIGQRSGLASGSSAISKFSLCYITKRPSYMERKCNAILAPRKSYRKRTRRTLELDGEIDRFEESEASRRKPKLADRVTFLLETHRSDRTQITRPFEELETQSKPSEKSIETKKNQENINLSTPKLLRHLRRSAYYVNNLVTEEESLQSEPASLQSSITSAGNVMANYQEAYDLVSQIAVQLQIAAETSSTRCKKLLDKQKEEFRG
ncbi:hypothetical protein CCR75_003621 [Bremia lactucae]|uniref:Telomere-associated protein Rif1 N-terminal domain-containing protein n=1 Tax=Bremia lactucae TaxID=4779 RepID=A0A976FEM9_BRELC|nr:hypothetical protein CCR75_003621 [Bremia lactucae]